MWRRIIVRNNIFEVETPQITPYPVLKASGHIDRFIESVVHDKDGNCFRADHLVNEHAMIHNPDINSDTMSINELTEYINEYGLIELNPLDVLFVPKVTTKNLTFQLESNADILTQSFLRPELAQGIFVNMENYLRELQSFPFGISQVGKSYRKEISPQPFKRLREFTQFETEYFFDPLSQSHASYDEISELYIPVLSQLDQNLGTRIPKNIQIKYAVDNGIICNEIMAYFLGKVFEFAKSLNLDLTKIRFRQHLENEMAHYAVQCWDLECDIYGNWLECVGCAHRGSYDLKAHNLNNVFDIKRNTFTIKKELSMNIKELKALVNYKEILADMNINKMSVIETISKYNLSDKYVSSKNVNRWDTFIPNCIEPSIGIDRLFYTMLVHNLYKRSDNVDRLVLTLTKKISPFPCAIFALSNKPSLIEKVKYVTSELNGANIKYFLDNSGASIGKKYVRMDQIGVQYCITVDFNTLMDNCVTIRSRDNMEQIRITIDLIVKFLI
jgi:glycyl-tRNA synthetase